MKKKIGILLLIVCCGLLVTGCNKTKKATAGSGKKADILYSVDGIDIKSVSIRLFGSTFNFQLVAANTTNEEKELDMSKFEAKLGDKVLGVSTSMREIAANNPYVQMSFTMSHVDDLKVGDSVKIYYDSKLIDTVTVIE